MGCVLCTASAVLYLQHIDKKMEDVDIGNVLIFGDVWNIRKEWTRALLNAPIAAEMKCFLEK